MPTANLDTAQVDAKQARDWWGVREMEVERELAAGLQRRMEAQRAQLYAFKTEQSKWEHELQLRISKYAHDRKLLSEHNVELQENLTAMEEKLLQYKREMDMQVQHVIELEGMVQANQIDAKQMRALSLENEELQLRVRQWEKFYRDEKVLAAKTQQVQQEELLTELERLLHISEDNLVARKQAEACSEKATKFEHFQGTKSRRKPDGDCDSLVTRIKELEAMCKQKDQSIISLKTIVEHQETTFDEKLRIVTAKYDQVKAINMALQKRLMHVLTEGNAKS